jgi:hypothetical protein
MRTRLSTLVLASIATAFACSAPQRRNPLASYERMLPGAWRVTYASGTSRFDTWSWGPGKHSLRNETEGLDAAGNPWHALEVVYWHPGREQVHALGLSPYAGGVSEGAVAAADENGNVDSVLEQTGRRRNLRTRTTFDGPDKYRVELSESVGGAEYATLTGWDYVRVPASTYTGRAAETHAFP